MYSVKDNRVLPYWVAPFGYLRVNALFQLTEAFRRYRVLHRLLMPRHPPIALKSLTKKIWLRIPYKGYPTSCKFGLENKFPSHYDYIFLIRLLHRSLFANWCILRFFKRRFMSVTLFYKDASYHISSLWFWFLIHLPVKFVLTAIIRQCTAHEAVPNHK